MNTNSKLFEENKNLDEKFGILDHKIKKIEKSVILTGNEQDFILESIDRKLYANKIIVFNLAENTNHDQLHITGHGELNNMFNNILVAHISIGFFLHSFRQV